MRVKWMQYSSCLLWFAATLMLAEYQPGMASAQTKKNQPDAQKQADAQNKEDTGKKKPPKPSTGEKTTNSKTDQNPSKQGNKLTTPENRIDPKSEKPTLRFGKNTPITDKTVRGKKTQEGKKDKLPSSQREKLTKETQKKLLNELKNQVKDAGTIAVDALTVPLEDIKLLADAAKQSNVDMIIEGMSGEDMAAVYGIGVTSQVVVARTEDGRDFIQIIATAGDKPSAPEAMIAKQQQETQKLPEDVIERVKQEAIKAGVDVAANNGATEFEIEVEPPQPGIVNADASPQHSLSELVNDFLALPAPEPTQKSAPPPTSCDPSTPVNTEQEKQTSNESYFFITYDAVEYHEIPKEISPTGKLTAYANCFAAIALKSDRSGKSMMIEVGGAGASATRVDCPSNERCRAGYLREYIVSLAPTTGQPQLLSWSPKSPNPTTSYTYERSWGVSTSPEAKVGGSEARTVVKPAVRASGRIVDGNKTVRIFRYGDPEISPDLNKRLAKLATVPAIAFDGFNDKVNAEWRVPEDTTRIDKFVLSSQANFGARRIEKVKWIWEKFNLYVYYRDYTFPVTANTEIYVNWGTLKI
jgi:hypothetical protein